MPSEFGEAVREAAGTTFTAGGLALLVVGGLGFIAGSFGVGEVVIEQVGMMLVGLTLFGFGRLVPRE